MKDFEERRKYRNQMRKQGKGQEPGYCRMLENLVVQSVVISKAERHAGDSCTSG